MSGPEFILCLECESPCYVFEWTEGEITDPFCEMCGNDQADQFVTEEELEALADDPRS